MRKFILRIIGTFNPNSKYDWFLLIAILYLSVFVTLFAVFLPEMPPPPNPLSPFG